MKEKKEETGLCSRRSLLAGSAALLTEGIVSGIQNIYAAPGRSLRALPPCHGSGSSLTRWKPAGGPTAAIWRRRAEGTAHGWGPPAF